MGSLTSGGVGELRSCLLLVVAPATTGAAATRISRLKKVITMQRVAQAVTSSGRTLPPLSKKLPRPPSPKNKGVVGP